MDTVKDIMTLETVLICLAGKREAAAEQDGLWVLCKIMTILLFLLLI